MFKDSKGFASFAVNDLKKAKVFYSKTLGFKVEETEWGLNLHFKGGGKVYVYEKSDDHVPANFTVLNIPVSDVEKAVKELTKKGVMFEIYSKGELKTDEKGISREWGFEIAWFKDPAGNFISIFEK